ncbi:Hypothetical protein D9617_15g043880 [Elsinoe fawcettii]|nr:Hypothetical protein D9617_15g043880 [Elsinoe fawcettii]
MSIQKPTQMRVEDQDKNTGGTMTPSEDEKVPREMHLVEVNRSWSFSRPMTLISDDSRLFVSETARAFGPKRFSIRLHSGQSAKDTVLAAVKYRYPWDPSYGFRDLDEDLITQWHDLGIETINKPGYDFMAGGRSLRWVLTAQTRWNPNTPYTLIDRNTNIILARFYHHSPMDQGKGKFVWDSLVNGVQETTAVIVMLWIFVRDRDFAPVHRLMAKGDRRRAFRPNLDASTGAFIGSLGASDGGSASGGDGGGGSSAGGGSC